MTCSKHVDRGYLREWSEISVPFVQKKPCDRDLIHVGRSIFSPALRKFSEKIKLTGADGGHSQKL